MKSLIRPLVAVVAVVTLAAGCASKAPSASGGSGAGGKKQFVVGYSQSNNAEPYRAQLNLQLEYFMKQHPDMKLLPIADAHQSSATQVSQVQNFIQQKVDVLIVSPNEPAPLTAAVQQACQAKIPVIILDRSVNTDCYTSFIGGDNYEIGKLAGQEAVKQLPNGGNVVELRGIMSDQPQIDRDKGFRDAVKANPKIKIVADREAKWLKDSAVPIMQQWLSKYPKIDLVYGHNDPMTLGAYLAAKAQHRESQIKFIGIDGLAIPDGGIRAVQLGELTSTFVYPTCAKEAADTAYAIAHGQQVGKKQVLHTTQVTKENAAQLYKQYDMSGKISG
ncbi:substrate-binding domain-containing protein [Actinoallomurus iriomotensis]|uniref:Sugar ABC transporter substrate-binding protein n=1 Tax=Actinoallomurus iriomotensis TaxID=478107 RepID=A0A9W6RCY8_9ACTN|nr:substrate-binding domain-containing protein [Actinoallomurus iriomotensis]GLY71772.1 sugar ABC transporter substrate-binding protein [Actinoallomurus iriomotensis]